MITVVLTFAVYAPSYLYDGARHEGWVWDDDDHFLHDPLIREPNGWWRVFADPQPGVVGVAGGAVVWNYWPVTRLSFWIDRHLWGVDARGKPNLVAARLTNVALHAANALLLAAVLRRLRVPGAALAGLLFAVHPVAVESVAWITERKALLSTTLFFATLLAWLRFEATGLQRWYLATAAAYVMTLLAKTSTVMFPVLLMLLHVYERRPWTHRAALRLAPFFAMSLVAGVTSIVFERFFIGSQGALFQAGLAERVATAGWIGWFYLAKTLVPMGVSFNYPRFPVDPGAWLHWVPTIAALAVAVLLWRLRAGRLRGITLALGAFAAGLFPVLGLFDLYGMRYAHVADHWLYLACAPILALAAASAVTAFARVPRAAGVATLLGVVVALGALSWRHAAGFLDRETLWVHTLRAEPDSFMANNNLGVLRLEARRFEEAIAHFERATAAEPEYPEGWVNLGNAFDASGRSAEAPPHWERAVALDPQQPIALYNLAVAAIRDSRLDRAEDLLRRALAVEARDARALQALQYVYEQQKRPEALDPFLGLAQQPPAIDRAARGRAVARAIWAAYAVAFASCLAIAWADRRAA